ncbi:unnamed protein product [Rangifer tarandus platyrhynchus]|uniref:Uncharacterized protein n=2 Tax=Rangifer tarandus platyrhynchus TaxID=3082113 RepID=A0ABN8ZZY5_RANTA|nr:unnamed protein product [Rangifer tarandus platyrhynchus]CAI9711232.1 unnamed protein product [Rangifer tarandus platyrhynchus]
MAAAAEWRPGGPASADLGGADSSPWTHYRVGTVPTRLEGSTSQTPQEPGPPGPRAGRPAARSTLDLHSRRPKGLRRVEGRATPLTPSPEKPESLGPEHASAKLHINVPCSGLQQKAAREGSEGTLLPCFEDHSWASAGPELGEGAVSVTLDEASRCQAANRAPAFLGAKLGPGSTPEGDRGEAAGPYRGEPAALEPPEGTSGMELPGLPEGPQQAGVCRDHPRRAHTSAPLSPGTGRPPQHPHQHSPV